MTVTWAKELARHQSAWAQWRPDLSEFIFANELFTGRCLELDGGLRL